MEKHYDCKIAVLAKIFKAVMVHLKQEQSIEDILIIWNTRYKIILLYGSKCSMWTKGLKCKPAVSVFPSRRCKISCSIMPYSSKSSSLTAMLISKGALICWEDGRSVILLSLFWMVGFRWVWLVLNVRWLSSLGWADSSMMWRLTLEAFPLIWDWHRREKSQCWNKLSFVIAWIIKQLSFCPLNPFNLHTSGWATEGGGSGDIVTCQICLISFHSINPIAKFLRDLLRRWQFCC